MTVTKVYTEPPICEKEMLRYAGCKNSEKESLQFSAKNGEIERLLKECLIEVRPKLTYKVCYVELPLSIVEDVCDFGCLQVRSKDLVKNLQGCEKAILFGATIGVDIDRLIAKYSRISPTKALMFQAIGTERIEALCDAFCEDVGKGMSECKKMNLRPRYSPGYGDVPLEIQREVFAILNCGKNIGLALNDSLLMSPSKSVTAFVGVAGPSLQAEAKKDDGMEPLMTNEKESKCITCNNIACTFREI